ncbi:hypothetical protein GCM10011511_35590 [Puia dinghuensis]|uniref:Uncharacterized protein n=2 Tax=Puia dinghuensis TaxID=1792502 RepID=A0A8J2UF13_9BACT|nr:hypothetical protein GCM10011511_35590 [Puia dinghuensis]
MGILFFNWYGYQLLTQYWQQQADSRLEARLDRNEYNESQLFSVKIPITSLSYYDDGSSNSFQRVDGQIDIGGVRYQYVKRRIIKDSLELLCIPNETAIKLQRVKNDFFRQVNDLGQQSQGKKAPTPVKNTSNDYQPTAMYVAVPDALAALEPVRGVYTFPYLPSYCSPTDEMPPDQAPALS